MAIHVMNNDYLGCLEDLLSDEKEYNIWTIRLTPSKDAYPVECADASTEYICKCEYIVAMFRSLKRCPYFVVYSESKKPNGRPDHYHARIVHEKWGTPANLYRWIKKWFPDEHGNALFATKKVWVKGVGYSGLGKSLSYTAKGKKLLQSRGYEKSVIDLAEKIGSEWKTVNNKEPKYKQIIAIYALDEGTPAHVVVRSVLKFYERDNKPPPTYYQLTRILQLIKFHIEPEYRELYTNRAISSYKCNWEM